MKVIKRDGTKVDFDKQKIINAIKKATESVGEIYDKKVIFTVMKELEWFKNNTTPTVEQIQDIVEKSLIEHNHSKIAKAYILYREKHNKLRNAKRILDDALGIMSEYLDRKDWKVNENSNMGYSLQGLHHYISSAVSKEFWKQNIYTDRISAAHAEGDIHIHDLGSLSAYCCGWDLKDLLEVGFSGVTTKVESSPPKHFKTALGQMVNFLFTLAGEAAGAMAFSNFDTYLAPFIRYDNLTYEEVKQSIQEFIYNMNVPTRVGFQAPFSNITMDLNCPNNIANEHPIIGGKYIFDDKLSDFQPEMDMINKAFAEVMLEGDSKGRVFSFPIPTYNITEDFDWDNKTLDPLWEMTAKYGIPYFSNFINSDMKPEDARSMCCRLRLDNSVLRKRGGGLFGANPMTGSIGVVTINMPRIGYLAKDKKDFIKRTFNLMDIAKESLEIKRRVVEDLTEKGLYPYSKFYLRSIKQRFNKYWQNHFNTIGINGMNEAMLNFLNKNMGEQEAIDFTIEVMEAMRSRMQQYQEETDNMYNLEATPAESTSYRFAQLDRKKFGNNIICANQERVVDDYAEPYYTNSSHLPVGYTDDIFETLELQDSTQVLYTGGTVLHGFIGERMPTIASTKLLVRRIAENFKLPYYSITPTFSICPIHGYLNGDYEFCPKCDAEMNYQD